MEGYSSEKSKSPIMVKFLLKSDDTITIEGNSVVHIFFEFNYRFPESFPCKAIGFSGETKEESEKHLKEFISLLKRYEYL